MAKEITQEMLDKQSADLDAGLEDVSQGIARLQILNAKLLAALKGVVSLKHEHPTGCVCPWCQARAAIKAADGEGE